MEGGILQRPLDLVVSYWLTLSAQGSSAAITTERLPTMASPSDDDEWDKDTPEIQSEDSDYLYENRPNRWRGDPRTWLSITEEERLTYYALERVRNQDLSLHLYNAWALRQRQASAAAGEDSNQEEVRPTFPTPKPDARDLLADFWAQDVDAETGEPVRNTPWVPPRSWTAWPLPPNQLPPDDFMKTTNDEDEVFTYRRTDDDSPRSRLEEVVSATTLRFAKERFRQRDIAESAHQGDESIVKTEPSASEIESQLSESGEHGEGDEGMDIDPESGGQQKRKQKAPARTLKPVVSTDDDVSYDLMRLSTRRIVEKFHDTLTILHNGRMTSAQGLEASGESSSESECGQGDHETPQKLSQPQHSSRSGSSPERSPSRSILPAEDGAGEPTKTKSNRGRPRKYVQREGESERDFKIRRGRALKGKIELPPTVADDDDDDGTTTTAGESQSSPRKRKLGRKRRRESMSEDKENPMPKKLARLNLRGWKDVMGAGTLAGFSPDVIARATQRCANSFGQGMEMHKIKETAASSGASAVKTTVYQPGGEMPSSSSESEEDVGDLDLRQARSMSRHSSAAPSRVVSPTSDEDDNEEGASPKKSPKRATSRGKGQHFCPYADCDRALAGFDRPFNLKRHMKLVHGQDSLEVAEKKEAATEDMIGGVYRDGFLQPIKVQKGWRAEDYKKRAKKNS